MSGSFFGPSWLILANTLEPGCRGTTYLLPNGRTFCTYKYLEVPYDMLNDQYNCMLTDRKASTSTPPSLHLNDWTDEGGIRNSAPGDCLMPPPGRGQAFCDHLGCSADNPGTSLATDFGMPDSPQLHESVEATCNSRRKVGLLVFA
jgi:hypothetical protein